MERSSASTTAVGGILAWRRRILLATAGVAVLLVLRFWIVCPYRIPSRSMEPTLHGHVEGTESGGDTVLVCKAAYLFSPPRRWDVVALDVHNIDRAGVARSVSMVKRVVGLPGERIEILAGSVVVDGQPAEVPSSLLGLRYLDRGPPGNREVVLGPGAYFVLGDHSYLSRDRRDWGPVASDRIFGKVLAVVSPLERATWLSAESVSDETR